MNRAKSLLNREARHRAVSLVLLGAVLLGTAMRAGISAAQEGRYQAIAIDSAIEFGTEKALILDSVAGHLWIWVESPAVNGEPGGRYLIYQGQLQPGKTMGQVIERQEWKAGAAE